MPSQPTTTSVALPAAGATAHVASTADGKLEFAFDPSTATFERSGTDLTITADNGGKVVLDKFFAVGDGTLPVFVVGEENINPTALLKAFDPNFDISTAAGPSASAASSSGAGSYADDSGSLLDGVNRMGSLGTDQWSRGTQTLQRIEGLSTVGGIGGDTGGGDGGSQPDSLHYQARGILYMGQNDQGADNFSFGVLHNAVPTTTAGVVGIQTAAGYEHNYGTYSYSGGRITYTLTQEGKDALAELPADENLYDYITVTVDGQSYTMQIVINHNDSFDSAAQDAADAAAGLLNTGSGGVTWGEWHSGQAHTDNSPYNVDASHGNNEVFYHNGVTGDASFGNPWDGMQEAVGFSGSLITHEGKDTVTIESAKGVNWPDWSDWSFGVKDGTVDTGAGDDVVNVEARLSREDNYDSAGYAIGMSSSTVKAGAGDNSVTVSAIGDGGMVNAVGMEVNSLVEAGAGDDSIRIVVKSLGDYSMTDGLAELSKVDAGDGNNLITVESYAGKGGAAYGMIRSDIVSGSGNDIISVSAGIGDTIRGGNYTVEGLIASSVDSGAGDDVISVTATGGMGTVATGMESRSSVNSGTGNDNITIAATVASGTAYGLNKTSVVDGGVGNDTITITATAPGGTAIGVAGGSVVDGGAGDDLIKINAATAAVSSSTVIGGTGSDTIILGDAAIRGGGNVSNSTIALGGNTAGVDTTDTDNNFLTVNGNVANTKIYGTDGKDVISVTAATGNALDLDTKILTGAGDDDIKIVGTTGAGVNYSTVNAGDGSDKITITGGSGIGVSTYGVVVAGAGSDTVTINGSVTNYSTISLGANATGVDSSDTSNNYATITGSLDNSAVYGTAGKDFIDIDRMGNAGSGGTGTVDTGAGDDSITVHGNVYRNSQIIAGTGSDTVYVGGVLSGSTVALGGNATAPDSVDTADNFLTVVGTLDGSRVYGAAGKDVLDLGSLGTIGAGGNNIVNTGAGDDSITVHGGVYRNSQIIAGTGSDTVRVEGVLSSSTIALGGNATAPDALDTSDNFLTVTGNLDSATVYGSAGKDVVDVGSMGTIGAGGYSKIDTGAGADSITVHGGMYRSSQVIAGTGSDTVLVDGSVNNSTIALGGNATGVDTTDLSDNFLKVNDSVSSSKIYGTVGKDDISVTSSASTAVSSSTIDAGAGNDNILVIGGNYAVGGATVIGGLGSDNIVMGDAATKTGGNVSGSTISLGDSAAGASATGVSDVDSLTVYGSVSSSKIYGDAGVDNVRVISTSTAWQGSAVESSTIDTGAGNDFIDINIKSAGTGGLVYGLNTSSTVNAGEGNDTVNVTATTTVGTAYGLQSFSTINAGSGENSINIAASAVNSQAYGVNYSTVTSGADNDIIKISATTGAGSAGSFAIINGTVDSGAGNDNITITAEGHGAYGARDNSKVLAGAGDDTITITVNRLGTGTTGDAVSSGSLVDGGIGNDKIYISATDNAVDTSTVIGGLGSDEIVLGDAATKTGGKVFSSTIALGESATGAGLTGAADVDRLTVYGTVSGSKIYGDAGKDEITIISPTSVALYNSSINAGDGENVIQLSGVSGMTGTNGSNITTGKDADNITVTGTGGIAMQGGFVNAGDGDNTVTFNGNVSLLGAATTVTTGTGQDLVQVGGSIIGNVVSNLGAGNDTLTVGGGVVTGSGQSWSDVNWSAATTQTAGGTNILGTGDDVMAVNGYLRGNTYLGVGAIAGKADTTGADETNSLYVRGAMGASIFGTAGADRIVIHNDQGLSANGTSGNNYGTIDLGNGRDTVEIVDVKGSNSFIAQGLTILGGQDDKNISVTSNKNALAQSKITLGDGDNTLSVFSGGEGLRDSQVTMGGGHNVVTYVGTTTSQYGGVTTTRLGDGGNEVRMIGANKLDVDADGKVIAAADATTGQGMSTSVLSTGNGADNIFIQGGAHGLYGWAITGGGEDTVFIQGLTGNGIDAGHGLIMGYTDNGTAMPNYNLATTLSNTTIVARDDYTTAQKGGTATIMAKGSGVQGSSVIAGNYDDTISITAGGNGLSGGAQVQLGHGDNILTVTSTGAQGSNGSTITTGDNNNVISVIGKTAGAVATNITTGSGHNLVTLADDGTSSAGTGYNGGLKYNTTTGAPTYDADGHRTFSSTYTSNGGSDTIEISGSRYGMNSAAINLQGGGRDYVSITATGTSTTGNSADNSGGSAMYGGEIRSDSAISLTLKGTNFAMFASARISGSTVAGADDAVIVGGSKASDLHGDDLIFKGNFGIQIEANELTPMNYVTSGAGNDFISLDGNLMHNGRNALVLDAGDGYDILHLVAADWTEFASRYSTWLTANLGSAHVESIQVDVAGQRYEDIPSWLSTLATSKGVDLAVAVHLDTLDSFTSAHDHTAYHVDMAAGLDHGVTLGGGDDRVTIESLDHATLDMGNGHNILTVHGAVTGGTITGGAHSDMFTVHSLESGTVNLGGGDDQAVFHSLTQGHITGGTGVDTLTLQLDGHAADGLSSSGAFKGLFNGDVTADNFEVLRLDLTGGTSDTLHLTDDMFQNLVGVHSGSDVGGDLKIMITGDHGSDAAHSDHVNTSSLTGWTQGATTTVEGVQYTTFTHGTEQLEMLIQANLLS